MVISIRVVFKMKPIKYYVGLFMSFIGAAGFVGSDSNTIVFVLSLLALGAGIVLALWGITQIRVKIQPLTLAEVEELKRDLKRG